jgi:hypothetical protein
MINPGAEAPIVTFQRRGFQVATPEKWGGKFRYTWEARDRNDVQLFTNAVRQLTNTIVRKINQRAVAVLDAYITANSRTFTATSWGDATALTDATRTPALMPARDFGEVQRIAEVDEMGAEFDLWIINPNDYANLAMIYGEDLDALLDSFGVDLFVTNRVTAGTAYVVSSGQVGEMRLEAPLNTRSWDDPDGIEQTWVQSTVRPAMYANNKFAVLKATGLNA